MIAIRWADPARADFLGIIEWITHEHPPAARRIGRRLLAVIERLGAYPHLGRPGRVPDTREQTIPGLPYLVVYALTGDEGEEAVVILRVLHGAMDWPSPQPDE